MMHKQSELDGSIRGVCVSPLPVHREVSGACRGAMTYFAHVLRMFSAYPLSPNRFWFCQQCMTRHFETLYAPKTCSKIQEQPL